MLLQVELSKVKQQEIPSGWGADSSGIVSIYVVGHLLNLFDIAHNIFCLVETRHV